MSSSFDFRRMRQSINEAESARFPARNIAAVTFDQEFASYGRVAVYNDGTATEHVVIVPVGNEFDDTTGVAVPIPAKALITLDVLCRRVLSAGTGSDISAFVLT